MSVIEREVEIPLGRRAGDGRIRLSVFADEMVAITIEGHGERAPTLLLSLEQARKLQSALSELIPLIEEVEREESNAASWRGEDRRRLAS
jgi:hypothetical protein